MEVKVNGSRVDLTKKEYALLLYFLTNKSRVITRQSMAEHLWGDYTENLLNFDFVYQHVKNLRKKICRPGVKIILKPCMALAINLMQQRLRMKLVHKFTLWYLDFTFLVLPISGFIRFLFSGPKLILKKL